MSIRRDPRIGAAAALPQGGTLARNALTLALAPMGIAVRRYYGVNPAAVQRAWELIGAAIDRFQAELQPSGYLVGERFSVADLTFAALIGSAVQPDGFPYRPREPDRRGLPEMRSLLVERGVEPRRQGRAACTDRGRRLGSWPLASAAGRGLTGSGWCHS